VGRPALWRIHVDEQMANMWQSDSMDVGPGPGSGVLLCVDSEIKMLLRTVGTSNGGELHGSTIVMQQPLRIV
jgi:hypothetical protein